VLLDLGLIVVVPGCTGNAGELTSPGGDARVGASFELAMSAGQEPGVLPLLGVSRQARVPGSPCGVPTIGGELLISPQHRVATFFLPPWDGVNPATLQIAVPNGGYQVSTGTSFSAAQVSGTVALMLQHKGQLTADQVRATLLSTAKDLGPTGRDDDYGAGLTDAYRALTDGTKTSAAAPAR
jgi:subtilisin family serine protease